VLLATAGGAIAYLRHRVRNLSRAIKALEQRAEALADQNWELREAEERARSFLEEQGDLFVRRTRDSNITYANEAYGALLGRRPEDLVGTATMPDILEQGESALLPDGSRMHDQKIASRDGPRWIAWREAAVRSDDNRSEIQSV